MDTIYNAMGKRSGRRDPQDFIADFLRQDRETPAETVARRFPRDDEQIIESINGPEGLPNFNWVNPAGMEAFLESAPMSENIEDRRGVVDDFIRSVLAR